MNNGDYISFSPDFEARLRSDMAGKLPLFDAAIRRNTSRDTATLWRDAFLRDIEKIINCPYYNRYTDKTQVFSFYKNDDISRRALHVQLVSRIARNIGKFLGLNLDLIEAIALGHDIGHTPFGHAGETILSKIYHERTGRYFMHNVHSVRVLDSIFHYNISLQTLDGILCHNGRLDLEHFTPDTLETFDEFDGIIEECTLNPDTCATLAANTLEGCIVRICDIIAYIGKDRQDATKAGMSLSKGMFGERTIGSYNAAIINNLCINLIENSYGKDYLCMDKKYFNELKKAKKENYEHIYESKNVSSQIKQSVEPIFEKLYNRLYDDLTNGDLSSPIFKHHIEFVNRANRFYDGDENYIDTEANQIVVDYIAGMTDTYFGDLCEYLFPDEYKIKYVSYFEDLL